MRLGWILAICLLWTSAVTFAADSHDTAMTANEALHAEHSADEISAVSGSQGGHYVHSLGRMMLIATLLGAALSIAGLALSYGPDLPAGPTIILLAGAVYVVSATFRQVLDRRRARLAVARHESQGALRE